MPRIVLAPFNVVNFPEGCGQSWVYMQYALGLRELGCDVWWMEQYASLINCHAYDAMIRRYVLQYVLAKENAPDRAVIDKAVPEIKSLLEVFDRAYGPRNTLAGDTVTLADLLLAPIVFYLGKFPESKALLAGAPNVTRAHAWIAERPSFKATAPQPG